MADQTQVPTWAVYLFGTGTLAGVAAWLLPAIKWIGAKLVKRLEKEDAGTSITVNVGAQNQPPALPGPGPGSGNPSSPALGGPPLGGPVIGRELRDDLVVEAVVEAVLRRLPAPAAQPSSPPALSVTRRDLDVLANRIPADLVTRKEIDNIGRRLDRLEAGQDKMDTRQDKIEAQQARFREKVLQRLARILERMQIQVTEERDDEDT